MKWLFVDTAGWFAAADAADSSNAGVCAARDLWLEQGGGLLTTDYVVDETLTLLRMRMNVQAAEKWWKQIEGSKRVRIEWINPQRSEQARTLFFRYRDKSFSFTDCISFVVMKELKIKKVLTLDTHFRQAGFDLLPAKA